MRHFMAYHNRERMGRSLGDNEPLHLTSKPVQPLLAHAVWFVVGDGKAARRYSLGSVFVVSEIGDATDDEFKFFCERPESCISAAAVAQRSGTVPGFLQGYGSFQTGRPGSQGTSIRRGTGRACVRRGLTTRLIKMAWTRREESRVFVRRIQVWRAEGDAVGDSYNREAFDIASGRPRPRTSTRPVLSCSASRSSGSATRTWPNTSSSAWTWPSTASTTASSGRLTLTCGRSSSQWTKLRPPQHSSAVGGSGELLDRSARWPGVGGWPAAERMVSVTGATRRPGSVAWRSLGQQSTPKSRWIGGHAAGSPIPVQEARDGRSTERAATRVTGSQQSRRRRSIRACGFQTGARQTGWERRSSPGGVSSRLIAKEIGRSFGSLREGPTAPAPMVSTPSGTNTMQEQGADVALSQ